MSATTGTLAIFVVCSLVGEAVSVAECTRKCTVDDTDSQCWRQSLEFYSARLLKSLEEYVGTLTHLSRWNHQKPKAGPRYTAMAQNVLAGLISEYSVDGDLAPLDAAGVTAVLEVLLNKTAQIEDHYNDPEVLPPTFLCPTPCEYHLNIWRTLFFVTLTVLLLLCISFFLYLAMQQLRQDKAKAR